ncbi:MAG: 4Fe-4S dicluster domain-containing protein, partial [Gammaproteobacteria bacterium]|nr:4Fe-4S dicluster domain-containing protein [Gammaproteobacteria bacterium]
MPEKILNKSDFNQLIKLLELKGYDVYGSQVKDGAIVYDALEDASQLPQNFSDEQQPGLYRLNSSQTGRWFSWANAAQGIKPLVFKPSQKLWSAAKAEDGTLSFESAVNSAVNGSVNDSEPSEKPKAIIGVRNCDLVALGLQDQHFLEQTYIDPYYETHRKNLFLVAVNCTHPAQTCFCHSTGDGPIAQAGYDIVLDELDDDFLVATGSIAGELIVASLSLNECDGSDKNNQLKQAQVTQQHLTVKAFRGPVLPNIDIQTGLKNAFDANYWEDIAKRCLSCGNCTSVCPTCFCYSEHDEAALDGSSSDHVRQWDSCFNQSHSYIHGIVIRSETKFRYRQWLTHKFSGWVEQYGRSGCVGCGRCMTWC